MHEIEFDGGHCDNGVPTGFAERVVGPLEDPRLRAAANRALATGRPVEVDDLFLVPDTVIVEAAANGLELGDTWCLLRHDGRAVSVFRWRAA